MYSRFSSFLKPAKCAWNSAQSYRVTVVGGASRLGQAVCMLLRKEPALTSLAIYDSSPQVSYIVSDLQHIPAESNLIALTEEEELRQALFETDILLTADGVPEYTEIARQDHVSANIALISMVSHHISKLDRMPFVGVATEPINTLVPMIAEIMQHQGKYEPKKLFGLTGVDSLRAQAMYATMHMLNPLLCSVPVICGHTSETAVPLLSQASPHRTMSSKAAHEFTLKFRKWGQDVTEVGPAPGLVSAYNAVQFVKAVIRAFETKNNPTLNVFVENNSFGTNFFAGRVSLTSAGAGEMQRYANISEYECNLLQKSIQNLKSEIFEGKKYLTTTTTQDYYL